MNRRRQVELALALGWLTRLPVRFPAGGGGERTLAEAVWAFPLAGVVVAAAGAAAFVVAHCFGGPGLLAAVLAVAAMVVVTGALHEDGVADFFDGLGARGGRAARLAAMRDSRIGVYGVIALFLLLAARVAALSGLSGGEALAALLAAATLSRAAMAWLMLTGAPARADGAGRAAGEPGEGAVAAAGGFALLALVAAALVAPFGIAGLVLAPVLALTAAEAVGRKAARRFGGYTGDVLGAACVMSETAVLILLALLLA
ncbi:MAG: cobalamin 5'-phosphate synthase [Rhizobiales bacterium NRL2]|jgi:adenosylcobinamide-GDP ribazoletransferase|nr:MAG: cobalamin 5'-phosphate synthase [Rhizobiales bacterium NRL2]